MRRRWEGGWGDILRNQAPRMSPTDRHKGELGRQLTYMLNWVEWMGVMIRMNWINRDVVLLTLRDVVKEMLEVNAVLLNKETKERGEVYWANALYMASLPEIGIDIPLEAAKLERIWTGYEHVTEFDAAFHDRLARNWPEPREQLHYGGWDATYSMVEQLNIQEGDSVLDVCCGEGSTTMWIATNFGGRVTGIDIVPNAVQVARKLAVGKGAAGNCNFVRGNVFLLPFLDESFDVILGLDADGYAHSQRSAAFKECFRVLRHGGRFGIHHWIPGVGAPPLLVSKFDRANMDSGFPSHSNVHADAYIQALQAAHFEDIRVIDKSEMYRTHTLGILRNMQINHEEVDPWITSWLELSHQHPFGVALFAQKV